ncbi:unnamed protein product [Vitrella brassicaformis CCMP3155]|uniref:PNPLA domain-containing protein n=1 Tax=Vitrella brassicaformis (strain CCMP3155) TaxID=1169540 RepID=A0A0G4GPE5_VITBC|nr:unnamed protein product [Vitrella brassicaformis CCMP3155]|eukprot:CEM32048.1 unnamed protein product [Vitrella brassicaformis CCMP3155]
MEVLPMADDPLTLNPRILVDGGVLANNPSIIGAVEAMKKWDGKRDNILMLSIGTGRKEYSRTPEQLKNAGLWGWKVPISSLCMQGPSEHIDYQVKAVLDPGRYIRIQNEDQLSANDLMDDASEQHITDLEALGNALFEYHNHNDELAEFLRRLA